MYIAKSNTNSLHVECCEFQFIYINFITRGKIKKNLIECVCVSDIIHAGLLEYKMLI